MDKSAFYDKKFHQLQYWDSKNTTITIDCRTLACAKMTLLANEKIHHVKQKLYIVSSGNLMV